MHSKLKRCLLAGAIALVIGIGLGGHTDFVGTAHAATTSNLIVAQASGDASLTATPSLPIKADDGTQATKPSQPVLTNPPAQADSTWMYGMGFVMMLVIGFYVWRRYKNGTRTVVVDKSGKRLPSPPERKFKQAELILPGDARFGDLTFDKVIGQTEAKFDIMEFIDFLQKPEKYAKMKARMPRGVLLYGAPGTGKTLLVKALAATVGIPVLVISGSDFVEMFVGVGASRVRDLYEDADALAQTYGWCVVFIDEIDAVGGKRGGGGHGGGNREHDQTINQLLVELDGVTTNPNIITIGASNRKDMLDPALLRPKRLDRHIEFFNPNRKDREELFALYIPEDLRGEDLNLKKAARVTASASGSHIEAMANEAKIFAARWGLDKVTARCLDEAILKVRMGPARDSDRAMMSPDELDTVKVHEGGHALVYWMLTGKAPERFTIIPRGQTGGHVEFAEDYEMLRTKKNLETHLAVAMGGWAATLVLRDGQQDTGISSDFDQATRIAMQMVAVYGMSPMGFLTVNPFAEANLLGEDLKNEIKQHTHALLEQAKVVAMETVTKHRDLLDKLIKAVEIKETLLSHDFEELMEGHLPPEDDDNNDDEPPAPPKGDDGDKDDKDPEIKLPEPVENASKKSGFRAPGWFGRRGQKNKDTGLPHWLQPQGILGPSASKGVGRREPSA
jgi:cell division protease FtsH